MDAVHELAQVFQVRRPVQVPTYSGITSAAAALRVLAMVLVVVGALLIVAGVLTGIGEVHEPMRRTGARPDLMPAVLAALPEIAAGLGCAVLAALLRLAAFVGIAVRDVARNSFELRRIPC